MEEDGLETLQLIAHPAHPPRTVTGVTARIITLDPHWCVLRWRIDGARDLVVPPLAGAVRADGLWQTTCCELFVAHDPDPIPAHEPLPTSAREPEPKSPHGTEPTPAHPEPVEGCARHLDQDQPPARTLRQAQGERMWGGGTWLPAYSEFNFSPSERWAAYDFTAYREGMAPRPMVRAPVITPRRGRDVLILEAAIRLTDLPPLPWRYGLTAVIEEAGGAKSYWAMAHGGERPDFHDPACHAARLAAPLTP